VSRRVLVVATATVPEAELRERVRAHAGEDAQLLVVVPASKISKLAWLTNAEDDARAEAAQLAEEVAEAVPGDDVETRVGDSDPVKAIEDALRDFPAEELIVITRPDEEAEWLEEAERRRGTASRFRSRTSSSSSKPARPASRRASSLQETPMEGCNRDPVWVRARGLRSTRPNGSTDITFSTPT
jgi:hypothetical protein